MKRFIRLSVLILYAGCGPTNPLPGGLHPIGTYEASAVKTIQYGTGATINGEIPLYAYVQYPLNLPPGLAVPAFVVFSGGGFDGTGLGPPDYINLSYWRDMVTAGAVCIAPYYRTYQDRPTSPNDEAGDTWKVRSIRAAFYDQRKFIEWFLDPNNRSTESYKVDPRHITLAGWSSGGVSAIRQGIDFNDQALGIVGFACGFGLAVSFTDPPTSDDQTRDYRRFIRETDITAETPPMLLFLIGTDPFVGGTNNAALRDRAEMFSRNTVYWKDNGGHDGPQQWGDVNYNGETVPVMEAIRRRVNEWIQVSDRHLERPLVHNR